MLNTDWELVNTVTAEYATYTDFDLYNIIKDYNEDNNSYYFDQLSKIEKIDLTKEQLDYFRKSQNNMYKQFVLISLYDSVKKNYNLIKYKKESW